jgi:hypothetical protein
MPNLKQLVMLASLFAVSAAFPAASAELATEKSSERGVTVAATPQNLSSNAKTWEFKIVLDTHSQDLGDDLLKTAVLLDGTGAKYTPTGWDGAGPGGHHREGVLRFKPVSPQPQSIELQITRAGEDAPRSYRWQLK